MNYFNSCPHLQGTNGVWDILVKGAALVGGLKRLEDAKVKFLGYGGSSAGAIVAALKAVGYSAPEIREEMDRKPFIDFLDGFKHDINWKKLIEEFPELKLKNSINVLRYMWKHHILSIIKTIVISKGLYDGNDFSRWLKGLIEKKGPKDTAGHVTFGSLDRCADKIDIRIVAADLQNRSYVVLSKDGYADLELYKAVRASMSIPLLFKPFPYTDNNYFVDGGVVSNFPAWIFQDEADKTVLGLRLESDTFKEINSFGSFGSALFNTIFEGANEIQNIGLDKNIHSIKINTQDYSMLDFRLSTKDKTQLYNAGLAAVNDYFSGDIAQ